MKDDKLDSIYKTKSILLAKEYYEEISKKIDNLDMILYGSTVFGSVSRDLDLCLVTDKEISEKNFDFLKKIHNRLS